MNPLAALLITFLLSCSMAVEPQVVVMIVLKTADNTFTCTNIAPLFRRFSGVNNEGKPVVNRISCPQVAEYFYADFRYVLLQLDFDANLFQAYTFRQKKTSEHVVQFIVQPFLLAGEEVEVYSVQEPATTSEYGIELDGFVRFDNQRLPWGITNLENATISLQSHEDLVKYVKYSIQNGANLANAYGFQIAYFYPAGEMLKGVVRFKTPHALTENGIKMLLLPNLSFDIDFDNNGLIANVNRGVWNRPVLEPQVVVMITLKTADYTFTCANMAPLFRRFTQPRANSEGTPLITQISCPKDTMEIINGYRHVLLQLNFNANTLREYANRNRKNLANSVEIIVRPHLTSGEAMKLVSVYNPDSTSQYLFQLDGIVTLNGVSDKWRSNFWRNVQSFKNRYNGLLQNVKLNIKRGSNSARASQFQFSYFYREYGRVRAVVWFKNPRFLTENEIRSLVNVRPLPTYRLFTTNLVVNVIEVNGIRPIIDTPEDFGHFADFWID